MLAEDELTGDIFSTTVAVGKKANVFATFSSSFVRCGCRVNGFRSTGRISVDVDKFLGFAHNSCRWFQRWPRSN